MRRCPGGPRCALYCPGGTECTLYTAEDLTRSERMLTKGPHLHTGDPAAPVVGLDDMRPHWHAGRSSSTPHNHAFQAIVRDALKATGGAAVLPIAELANEVSRRVADKAAHQASAARANGARGGRPRVYTRQSLDLGDDEQGRRFKVRRIAGTRRVKVQSVMKAARRRKVKP